MIEVDGLKKAMGDKLLIEGLSFALPPGGIVGVIGPNGAGKSTLFKMLTGQESPDSGSIEVGDTVDLAYVDQSRDDLQAGDTVWEAITGGAEVIELGDASMNSRAYCSAFNFRGGDQQKKVGLLSGGERNRVHMARLLKSGLRGRGPCGMVRGQFRRLRGRQETPPGRRRAGAQAVEIQEILTLGRGFSHAAHRPVPTCAGMTRERAGGSIRPRGNGVDSILP